MEGLLEIISNVWNQGLLGIGVTEIIVSALHDGYWHLAKTGLGAYVLISLVCISYLKHVTLQGNNCFIGFKVSVYRCSVATTQNAETTRLVTVVCWLGGSSSRSELDNIYLPTLAV